MGGGFNHFDDLLFLWGGGGGGEGIIFVILVDLGILQSHETF